MKKAFLQLHTAILLAGFTAILGKLISLGATTLVWWRLLITVVVLYGFMVITKKKRPYPALVLWQVMGIGMLVGFHWLCFFSSIKLANVSVALVCLSASGLFSALLDPVINKRGVYLPELLLGMLSILGIYIIFHFDTRYKMGIAVGVLSSLFSALFPILNKNMVKKVDNMSLTLYEMTGAMLIITILLPLHIFGDGSNFWPVGLDWLWLVILAVLCTVWAFILQLKALGHISAFTLNLSYNLEPVYGILVAFIIFKENQHLNNAFYLGAALILTAVFLQMFLLKRKYSVNQ